MAHLVEHLYVTAGVGNTEARSIQTFISQYPDGWNAQTGRDYTLIATVFPKMRLESELKDAATRMSKLNIKNSDLKREIPRINNELVNMYGGIPALGALNLASDMILAQNPNSRKGGIINQIKSIDVKQIHRRIQAFYRPQNAMIIIAGDIDIEQVKKIVDKTFSGIESGKKMETVHLAQKLPAIMTKRQKIFPRFSQAQAHVALAFRAPKPSDRLFPAFLILAARLQSRYTKLKPPKNIFPVNFAVLDRPEVIIIHFPVMKEKKADRIVDKLKNYVFTTTSEKLATKDINNTKQIFGFTLGLQQYPDRVLLNNIYGVAFSAGMKQRLGIESQKLSRRLNAVTQDELTETIKEYFAPEKYSTVIVTVK